MATKVKFTYEDYLLTEEGKRYDLIDGDLLMTPEDYRSYALYAVRDKLFSPAFPVISFAVSEIFSGIAQIV